MQTLEGHAQNVSCVSFHPELPIIVTGSEDGKSVKGLAACDWFSFFVGVIYVALMFRHGAHLALQHLPTGEHAELRHGAGVVRVRPARFQ